MTPNPLVSFPASQSVYGLGPVRTQDRFYQPGIERPVPTYTYPKIVFTLYEFGLTIFKGYFLFYPILSLSLLPSPCRVGL